VEFSELAAGIQNHRFDGWTNTAIADQITRMINGDGTGSIGTAVDALKAVATALAHTDQTLRAQLLELGVEWQSQAGGAASQVFTEQAGFSQDATTKVAHAAEMVFEQGEAFNRTKYKLPDAETVRKGAGGFTLTDGLLMSLIGFETDHARQVEAANDAKAQAQQQFEQANGGIGNVSGFETQFQKQASPYAFIVARMDPADRKEMIAKLQGSAQGRQELGRLSEQLQFLKQAGLAQ